MKRKGNRYRYTATYLAFLNSHGLVARKGYQWWIVDSTQQDGRQTWLPYKIIQRCFTRREARELCKELNTRGFVTLEYNQ